MWREFLNDNVNLLTNNYTTFTCGWVAAASSRTPTHIRQSQTAQGTSQQQNTRRRHQQRPQDGQE